MAGLGDAAAAFRALGAPGVLCLAPRIDHPHLLALDCVEDVGPGRKSLGPEANPQRAGRDLGNVGCHRPALLLPQRKSAIDQADPLDAQVTQEPPEPSGVELASGVVDQDQRVGSDAQRLDP